VCPPMLSATEIQRDSTPPAPSILIFHVREQIDNA
jgi:hypothetical protein